MSFKSIKNTRRVSANVLRSSRNVASLLDAMTLPPPKKESFASDDTRYGETRRRRRPINISRKHKRRIARSNLWARRRRRRDAKAIFERGYPTPSVGILAFFGRASRERGMYPLLYYACPRRIAFPPRRKPPARASSRANSRANRPGSMISRK